MPIHQLPGSIESIRQKIWCHANHDQLRMYYTTTSEKQDLILVGVFNNFVPEF